MPKSEKKREKSSFKGTIRNFEGTEFVLDQHFSSKNDARKSGLKLRKEIKEKGRKLKFRVLKTPKTEGTGYDLLIA